MTDQTKKTSSGRTEVRVRGVSSMLVIGLENIAKNKGYATLTAFLKIEFRNIYNNAPERFKKDHNL